MFGLPLTHCFKYQSILSSHGQEFSIRHICDIGELLILYVMEDLEAKLTHFFVLPSLSCGSPSQTSDL
jgi:hypothetical protein